jgi:hypothetical protein
MAVSISSRADFSCIDDREIIRQKVPEEKHQAF